MANDPVVAMFDRMKVEDLVQRASKTYGVPPELVHGLIQQESNYDPRAESKVGARGLMQLMPGTAQDMGVKDPFDPAQNIEGGTRYLSSLLKRYGGDQKKALAAYNAGMGNVDRGKAQHFPETQNYVKRVSSNVQNYHPLQMADEVTLPPQGQLSNQPNNLPPQTGKPGFSVTNVFTRNRGDVNLPAEGGQVKTPEAGNPEEEDPLVAMFDQMKQTKPQKQAAQPPAEEPGFFNRLKNHPVDTLVDELPTIGGAVGGIVGGIGGTVGGFGVGGVPGAVGGAALGGGAGEAARRSIRRLQGKDDWKSGSMLEDAKGIAEEGAIQGGTELAGAGAGAVISKVGKGVMKRAFKPTADMLLETPSLIDDLAREGINPTKRGISTMDTRTTGARKVAEDLVHEAGKTRTLPNGVRVTPTVKTREVAGALVNHPYSTPDKPLDSVLDMINKRFEKAPLKERLGSYIDNVLADNPRGLTYDKLLALRRGEGKAASQVFEGALQNPSLESQLHAGMEAGSRKALETRVPGFAKANDLTENKLRVLEAVKSAVKNREANTGTVVVSKLRHMAPSAALGVVTANPLLAMGGWAATEALTHPAVEATIGRNLMRAGRVGTKVLPTIARAGQLAIREDDKTTTDKKHRAVSKKKVDSLYSRYRADK